MLGAELRFVSIGCSPDPRLISIPMSTPSILSASELRLGYGRSVVVEGLNFELHVGQLMAVVGHNGSGKSSLVRTLLGLLPVLGGQLAWQSGSRPKIGYLGQRMELDRSFPMKCRDLVASGGWELSGFAGLGGRQLSREDLAAATEAALNQVELQDKGHLQLHQLSGGQLQRALFARALVQDAPVIILDEPFAGVDQSTEQKLLDIVLDWVAEDRSVILVSHDLSSVLSHAQTALLLGEGRARFGSPCEVLSHQNLIYQNYMSQAQADWLKGTFASEGMGHV